MVALRTVLSLAPKTPVDIRLSYVQLACEGYTVYATASDSERTLRVPVGEVNQSFDVVLAAEQLRKLVGAESLAISPLSEDRVAVEAPTGRFELPTLSAPYGWSVPCDAIKSPQPLPPGILQAIRAIDWVVPKDSGKFNLRSVMVISGRAYAADGFIAARSREAWDVPDFSVLPGVVALTKSWESVQFAKIGDRVALLDGKGAVLVSSAYAAAVKLPKIWSDWTPACTFAADQLLLATRSMGITDESDCPSQTELQLSHDRLDLTSTGRQSGVYATASVFGKGTGQLHLGVYDTQRLAKILARCEGDVSLGAGDRRLLVGTGSVEYMLSGIAKG